MAEWPLPAGKVAGALDIRRPDGTTLAFLLPLFDVVLIGRAKYCDLMLADQSLSREHARIRWARDEYFIRDLETPVGTKVNGVRIQEEVRLCDGDVIRLGDHQLTFHSSSKRLDGTLVFDADTLLAAMLGKDGAAQESVHKATESPAPVAGEPQVDRTLNKNLPATNTPSDASLGSLSDQSLQDPLEVLLALVFKLVKAERGVVLLRQPGSTDVDFTAVRLKGQQGPRDFHVSRALVRKVVDNKISTLLDFQEDWPSGVVRSALCVPLWNNLGVVGLLYVDSPGPNAFTADDVPLLTALGYLAAARIESGAAERVIVNEHED